MASEHSQPPPPHAGHAADDATHAQRHAHRDAMDLRGRALDTLRTDIGRVGPAAIDRWIETCDVHPGPHNGTRVVARAWTDLTFAARLARDATAAIASLGYSGRQGAHMAVVFSTPEQHPMGVCARVPDVRGRCGDGRRFGAPLRRPVPAPWLRRARCAPTVVSRCRKAPPSRCGVPPLKFAPWWCQSTPKTWCRCSSSSSAAEHAIPHS